MNVLFLGLDDLEGPGPGWARALGVASDRFRARAVTLSAADLEPLATSLAAEGPVILVHTEDDYASLARFAELAARLQPAATIVCHPYGPYRFEHPRADRIDEELGFAARWIAPTLLRQDARTGDRPTLPAVMLGPEPSRADPIVIGHRPRDAHPEETALVERAVGAVLRRGTGVEWRPDDEGCAVFVDHVDPAFGGYSHAAVEAMARGAVCLAAVRVGPHVEAHWPRPPVIVVEDAAALGRQLAALLDDRDALHAARLAAWRWARDVASEPATGRRLEGWLDEALAAAARRVTNEEAPLWSASPSPRVAAAVIARCTDRLAQASLCAALRSVACVTDECVVVLDERSAPGTDAMLERLGARVIRRTWTDDFAAARNYVHDHARAEWLLVIDGDEVLARTGDLADAIENADAGGHQAVMTRVQTVGDQGVGEILWQFRAYRRSACQWRYAVHNELVGVESVVPTTALFHASYVGTAADKAARSLPLLHRYADAEPDEPRWAHFLAQTYNAIGDTARMVEWAERCVDLAPDAEAFVHRWCDLALARYADGGATREALATIVEAVKRHPSHPDGWHVLATIALAEWHRAAGGPPSLSPVRSGHHAKNLPAAAAALGLPLEHVPRARGAPREARRADPPPDPFPLRSGPEGSIGSATPHRLRVAFVCGADTKFIAGIEDVLEERCEVRRLHFTERAPLRDIDAAMEWADVVWFEWCDELLVEASRRLTKTARVIVRLHCYEVFTDLPGRVRWEFVDCVVFVADHIRRIFESRVPARPRTVVIPNAIDTERLRLARSPDPYALAYVGYLNSKKSPELLLQCMAELVRRDPRYHVHIAGTFQDARYQLYFDKMIPALGLTEHITMHGWVEDVDAWLDDKGFIVSTSLLESFGVGIMEGMTKGLTPVIHDWVGAEEIYPQRYLFRTVSELADRVFEGRDEPSALRTWVQERYDLPRVVETIEGVLEALVDVPSLSRGRAS